MVPRPHLLQEVLPMPMHAASCTPLPVPVSWATPPMKRGAPEGKSLF